MTRSGVEAKPAWQQLPRPVRAEIERALDAPVRRAQRVWGGYAASTTLRLALADGRRAFFKGANPHAGANAATLRRVVGQETHVYERIGHLLSPWAPELLGVVQHDAWQGLLLEDLGPQSVLPWTPGKTRRAARSYAEFHRSTLGQPLPRWLSRQHRKERHRHYWERIAAAPETLEGVARMGARSERRAAEAQRWLVETLPVLRVESLAYTRARPPFSLLHTDTRSDNVRLHGSLLRIFDWPYACVGPPEYDLAEFAQSITVDGGPSPEQVVSWYAERCPVREALLTQSAVALAGFFGANAWLPAVPGLPRLRPFQQAQFRVCIAWVARRLRLPEPDWL